MVKGTRTQDAGPACGQIVVGYEGSPASQCALVWAATVSRALDDSLKIVHAVELDLVPSRRGYAWRLLRPSLEMVVETLVGGPSTWSAPWRRPPGGADCSSSVRRTVAESEPFWPGTRPTS